MLWILAIGLAQEPSPRYDEDFENRQSLDVVYDYWERVRSPEHPAYNTLAVELDPAGARSGRHVLRLVTRGGAVALRMTSRGLWRVDPSRPYRLSVHARISGATRNAASAALEWLDRQHERLREDVSEPLAAAGAPMEWTPIVLDVLSPPPTAVWARVKLQYAGGDVRGECRFDALSLEAITRLEIAPVGRISPIFEPGTPARFELTARGLAPGEYRLTLRSHSADGAEAHRAGPLAIRPDRPCRVELPPHAPGYYDLLAELAGTEIRAASPLVVPNGWIFPARAPRWIGMSINPFERSLPDAAALAQLAGCDRVRLTFSDRSPAGRGAPDASRLSDLVRLLAMPSQARVTGVLARPSAALFPHQDVEGLGHLFSPLRRDAWEAPLKALAGRYAGVVDAWEVGALRLGADLQPRADLGPAAAATAAVDDPAAFVRSLLGSAGGEPFLALDAPLVDAKGLPRPSLVAIRALNDLLSGAKVWRDAPPLLNVNELAFEKDGLTILAFWNPVETEREAHLGDGAIVYPPLGAARPHRPGERLRIGPMPLLVVKR